MDTDRRLVVELSNVYHYTDRGEQVFNDLSLRIPHGRSAVVVGSAGSGKTSLVDLIIGFKFPGGGSVTVLGESVRKGRRRAVRRIRRKIGGVGGRFGLVPSLTVAENITLPLVIGNERRRVLHERLFAALTNLALLQKADVYPSSLTRVESWLVMYARASVANQPLIIIDEPAAGLDSRTFLRVIEYLVKAAIGGTSMVILTSDPLPLEIPNTDYYMLEGGKLK